MYDMTAETEIKLIGHNGAVTYSMWGTHEQPQHTQRLHKKNRITFRGANDTTLGLGVMCICSTFIYVEISKCCYGALNYLYSFKPLIVVQLLPEPKDLN